MKHIASLSKAQPAKAQLGVTLKGIGGRDFATAFFQAVNSWFIGQVSEED